MVKIQSLLCGIGTVNFGINNCCRAIYGKYTKSYGSDQITTSHQKTPNRQDKRRSFLGFNLSASLDATPLRANRGTHWRWRRNPNCAKASRKRAKYLKSDEQVKVLESKNELFTKEIEDLKRIVQEAVIGKKISAKILPIENKDSATPPEAPCKRLPLGRLGNKLRGRDDHYKQNPMSTSKGDVCNKEQIQNDHEEIAPL